MAMLSESMLREFPAREFDYTTSPYTKLVITREDGAVVMLLYERSTGIFAWSRIVTNGKIKSIASVPSSDGYDELFMLVERDDYYYLEVLRETSEVYLDCFKQWDGDRTAYNDEAVIYDEIENIIYPLTDPLPEASITKWIGYPFTSRVRSMPILGNDRMKPNNIKNILIRFMDSYMPKLKALPNDTEDIITAKEPFTGVWKTMFPGVWDRDVMFELFHNKPTQCKILAINAEVN